ncbi:winged helix-turn-helix domain-containing protein [Planotetraspora sp. GP83]|uniref:winged helix-turn-helix domain-containing protein n=1 Tax=Planotetraspora sp. GP83 TaxID=3156264 RepID=UPI00351984C6
MSHVIDFAARQREQGHEKGRSPGGELPPIEEGTVLSVLPIPGVDAALVIVGHMVPMEGGRQALDAVQLSQAAQIAQSAQFTESSSRSVPNTQAVRQGERGQGVHLRHARPAGPVEDVVIDRAARVVRADGEEIDLTFREFELLDYLSSAPGRVFNRRQLMAAVWDRYGDEGARTVDVHVLRLRRKLGRHADRIVTVRNVGYKYQPPRG